MKSLYRLFAVRFTLLVIIAAFAVMVGDITIATAEDPPPNAHDQGNRNQLEYYDIRIAQGLVPPLSVLGRREPAIDTPDRAAAISPL